ncbi:MAG: amidohydrolase family protein [Gemmataceae bacterium]
MPQLDRREFVASSLALAGSARRPDPELPIIDTHQHLWDLGRFRLPWIAKGSKLDRSYLMGDYLAATKGLGVVQAVYMEVDVDPKQQLEEAEALVAICKKGDTPTRAAVISGRPAAADFPRYIKRFEGSPHVKGLRQVLHGEGTKPGYCLEKPFVAGVRLLGELGLRYDLCLRHAELPDAVKLVSQCPDTRFVLDHCGNPDLKRHERWKKDLAALARHKNVVCKVSGIVASAPPGWRADDLAPVVNHTLDTFGPDRVMFGGDWPVCLLAATFSEWVRALKEIVSSRPAKDQGKLFHDNAVAFYGLDTKGGRR